MSALADFIVVGAGSAGYVVAARLAQQSARDEALRDDLNAPSMMIGHRAADFITEDCA